MPRGTSPIASAPKTATLYPKCAARTTSACGDIISTGPPTPHRIRISLFGTRYAALIANTESRIRERATFRSRSSMSLPIPEVSRPDDGKSSQRPVGHSIRQDDGLVRTEPAAECPALPLAVARDHDPPGEGAVHRDWREVDQHEAVVPIRVACVGDRPRRRGQQRAAAGAERGRPPACGEQPAIEVEDRGGIVAQHRDVPPLRLRRPREPRPRPRPAVPRTGV